MLNDTVAVNQDIPLIVSSIQFQNMLRIHLISAKLQPDLCKHFPHHILIKNYLLYMIHLDLV